MASKDVKPKTIASFGSRH